MNEMQIEITPITGGTLIRLTGEGSMTCVDRLQTKFLGITASHPSVVVFDLAGLSFVASLFMGALVGFRRGIVRNGGQVRLAAMQPNVESAFRAARLEELFAIVPTVDAAVEANP